jgi:hypothetical protein
VFIIETHKFVFLKQSNRKFGGYNVRMKIKYVQRRKIYAQNITFREAFCLADQKGEMSSLSPKCQLRGTELSRQKKIEEEVSKTSSDMLQKR